MHVQPYRQRAKKKTYLCKGKTLMGQIVRYGAEASTAPKRLVVKYLRGYDKLCDVIVHIPITIKRSTRWKA